MKRVVLTVLALAVSIAVSGSAFAENLKKDDVVYAKYSIRGKGKDLYWHNISSLPVLVPAGAEVKIADVNVKQFVIETAGNKFWFTANTAQWDKYFVKNKNDASKAGDSAEVKEGMSKEEVYLAKGCPSFTARGEKTYSESMQDIMARDTWYYNATTKALGALIKFSNGRVYAVEIYKVGQK
ncbi:MAG: hypothetical protein HQL18_03425 [Candidatus Omnitrophica bacterium]|nr:hypothetical protein [Candidatus Omnitrophota bacterium]